MNLSKTFVNALFLLTALGLSACQGDSSKDGSSPSSTTSSLSDILKVQGMPLYLAAGTTKTVTFEFNSVKAGALKATASGKYCFTINDMSVGSKINITPDFFCLAPGAKQLVTLSAPQDIDSTKRRMIKVTQTAGDKSINVDMPSMTLFVNAAVNKQDTSSGEGSNGNGNNNDSSQNGSIQYGEDGQIISWHGDGPDEVYLAVQSLPRKISSGMLKGAVLSLSVNEFEFDQQPHKDFCFSLDDSSDYTDKLGFSPSTFCLFYKGQTQSIAITAPDGVTAEQIHKMQVRQSQGESIDLPPSLSITVTPAHIEKALSSSTAPQKITSGKEDKITYTLTTKYDKDQGRDDNLEYCFSLSDLVNQNSLVFSPSTFCLQGLNDHQDITISAPNGVKSEEDHYIEISQTKGKSIDLPDDATIQITPKPPAKPPKLIGYFTNYGVYGNNSCIEGTGSPGRAIPYVSYPMPRESSSISGAPIFQANGNTDCTQLSNSAQTEALENTDLAAKAKELTGVAYAFLFVYDDPDSLPSGAKAGQIHFTDSYSDLDSSDADWCNKNDLNFRICTPSTNVDRPGDLTWYLRYGNFDAFAALDQYNADIEKIVSIGGWNAVDWNVYQTGNSATDTQRIDNLVESVQALANHFAITEVDLDVENDGKTENFNDFLGGNLATIIHRLHDEVTTKDGQKLKVSLTIQANPTYVNALKDSVLSSSNIDNLAALNLMTYDFTVPGTEGYTGFNQVLFMPDTGDGLAPNNFTIDAIVQAAKKAMPGNENKINIGLAAYTRSLNGYNNNDITDNYGFGNYYTSSDTQLLGGDNDTANCSKTLGQWNSCASSFNHRYLYQFINQGNTHDFVVTKDGEDYHVGSTLIIDTFTPPQPNDLFGISPADISPLWSATYNGPSVFFYTSGQDAFDYGRYAAQQGIGGAIMWTVDGDVPVSDTDNSLIVNFHDGYLQAQD
ncbi:glycosyl hydrolase family 18 protein [Facilibium subflavum]|uniref:glycosyl hydrolase family 18 protein n=1 Tax=Facilibium subflavum TaxID=2219058 RepID=UPI000E64CC79|nr:glycosyl hydrolase family 18 protein [Facilibium subflavum]